MAEGGRFRQSGRIQSSGESEVASDTNLQFELQQISIEDGFPVRTWSDWHQTRIPIEKSPPDDELS